MNDYAGFDIVANRILEVVDEYIYGKKVIENGKEKRVGGVECHFDDDLDDTEDNINKYVNGGICYWVTGHSMGGAVANLVSASIISSSAIPELQNLQGTSDNVYCYTFAAPNTFYSPDNKFEERITYERNYKGEWREPKGNKYRCIFNIVNDDDFVPKVPMEKCNWTKYGRTAKISVNDIKAKVPSDFNPIYASYGSYYKLWLKDGYIAKPFITDASIAGLGAMYIGSNTMRRDTYDFGINLFNVAVKPLYDITDDPYTKPFQKRFLNIQQQTPAYLMTSIAYAMHEYNNDGVIREYFGLNENKINFAKKHFAKEFVIGKLSLLIGSQFGEIEKPHYLESYYALCKEIGPTAFK